MNSSIQFLGFFTVTTPHLWHAAKKSGKFPALFFILKSESEQLGLTI